MQSSTKIHDLHNTKYKYYYLLDTNFFIIYFSIFQVYPSTTQLIPVKPSLTHKKVG